MTREVRLPLVDEPGHAGTLIIAVRFRRDDAIHDTKNDASRARGAPRFELDESVTYSYRLVGVPGQIEVIEPSELMRPLTATDGSLNTRGSVGRIEIEVVYRQDGALRRARAEIGVRPRKLDEDAFQAMLADISDVAVELIHQGFAPATGGFTVLPTSEPRLLYQQFALLHQQLFSRDVQHALRRILAHPHRVWKTVDEPSRPGVPFKSGARVARRISAAGPRRELPDGAPLPTVPRTLTVERTESTYDNVPNRQIRFVLERWRALTVATDKAIAANGLGEGPWRRGRYQVNRTLDLLDELLSHPILREVSGQRTLPRANQVLLKRDGYRQVVTAAGIVDASLGLDVTAEDPFLISRRNVERLYEYWCFMKLAQQLGAICGESRASDLFELRDGGMTLKLKQAKEFSMTFVKELRGQRIEATLFNTFPFKRPAVWGRELHPDCSLRLRIETPDWGGQRDWWIHFDTKYRIERSRSSDDVTSDDIVKMHAYHGAIRDSVAAYVLFPGTGGSSHRLDPDGEPFAEALPAVGALPLRPDGTGTGAACLRAFLEEAFELVIDQSSRLRRARYWSDRAYGDARVAVKRQDPVPFLSQPPADTSVMLGFVRDASHQRWIEARGRYNVRSGRRRGGLRQGAFELDAQLLLLYGRGPRRRPVLCRRLSSWVSETRETLLADGYPRPNGATYLCCAVEPVADAPEWLGRLDLGELFTDSPAFGAPVTTTWLDLLGIAR